ncbi:hypothetical protein ABPG72_002463 [Tetrahymena utriculariae]
MTKVFILGLIATIYSFISLANCQSVNCKNHPIFQKSQNIIQNILKNDNVTTMNATGLYNVLSQMYQNAIPKTVSDSDVGICSDYSGDTSCCFQAFTQWIDYAALLKVLNIQSTNSAYQQLVDNYVAYLYDGSGECNQEYLPYNQVSNSAIYGNRNLKKFQGIRQNLIAIKVGFAQNITSFTRGVLCGMCVGVDNVQNYFNDNGLLKIKQSSLDYFVGNTTQAVQFYLGNFTQKRISDIIDEFNSGYIKISQPGGQNCAKYIKDKLTKQFSNLEISEKDLSGNPICPGTIAFGDNSACENNLQGSPALNPPSSPSGRILFQELQDMLRLLQATIDAVGDPNIGINAVTNSTQTDSVIDETGGNIQPNFNEINPNNSNILVFIGLLSSVCGILL